MSATEPGSSAIPQTDAARHYRFLSIDVTRGIIMVVMALDHASVAWNAGRSMFEAALPPIGSVTYANLAQQFVREITHVCAPASSC